MADNYLIGIDIGTQGTKTSLISVKGEVISEAFEPSRLIYPEKGAVEQDADEIFNSCLTTIKEVLEKSSVNHGDILAVGIDGQMAGVLGIDKDWNAVTPYDSWLDTRCGEFRDEIKDWGEERVISITGCPVTYAHGPKVLWWKNKRPETYNRISKFLVPSAFAAGKLCGLKADKAFIDHTHLHFSGYSDTLNKKWSKELLDAFKVSEDKMPEIVESYKVVGGISAENASKCGLKEGTPVIAGCGDTAATSLGAGITKKGLVFDVAGTASVFSCCVDEFSPDVKNKTLMYARSIIPGLWNPMAYINGGGMCLKWFRDDVLSGEKESGLTYKELDALASGVRPGSESLVFVPHFSGRVCPNNPNVRGSWVGLNWVHTKAHMYRSIMEGIAYEYRIYLKIIKSLVKDVQFSKVLCIGGGAKGRLFNSIKADVLGIPYTTLNRSDTATLGAAVLAGYGTGVYNDLAFTMNNILQYGEEIRSSSENNALYGTFADAYELMFESLEGVYRKLLIGV